MCQWYSSFKQMQKIFFKYFIFFKTYFVKVYIQKKINYNACTSYFTLNVKFQSCQFLYKLVKWLNTNQLPQNGQLTMPYHTGFLMLHTIVCTKKKFDMQSINYPNNYTSPNKILVIRQNAHLVLRNVGKTLWTRLTRRSARPKNQLQFESLKSNIKW